MEPAGYQQPARLSASTPFSALGGSEYTNVPGGAALVRSRLRRRRTGRCGPSVTPACITVAASPYLAARPRALVRRLLCRRRMRRRGPNAASAPPSRRCGLGPRSCTRRLPRSAAESSSACRARPQSSSPLTANPWRDLYEPAQPMEMDYRYGVRRSTREDSDCILSLGNPPASRVGRGARGRRPAPPRPAPPCSPGLARFTTVLIHHRYHETFLN